MAQAFRASQKNASKGIPAFLSSILQLTCNFIWKNMQKNGLLFARDPSMCIFENAQIFLVFLEKTCVQNAFSVL